MTRKQATPIPESQAIAQAAPRLRMENIRKRFGATIALNGVSLHVGVGEVLALVGENGAGKSTLMKVLSGAERPDSGQMWLDERPYAPRDPADGRRAGVAMIYQELSLAPHLTVNENIVLGVEPRRGMLLDRAAARRLAADALARVGRPDLPLNRRAAELPIAEQQIVEIARGVAVGCRVLVLDEPTSSLTQTDVHRLFTLIRRLRENGQAIVYISHALEEVLEIADRYVVLRDGATVGGGEARAANLSQIVTQMVGREIRELYPRSSRAPGDPVLVVDELWGARLPRGATLALRRGEVLGIFGLIGAGRTELLRAIFGLDAVKRGLVRVATTEVAAAADRAPRRAATPAQRWLQRVGLVSEDRAREGLALGMSVADNVTLPALGPGAASGVPSAGDSPTARARRFLGIVSRADQQCAAARWIAQLGIRCRDPRQPAHELSGGNQQKVALARLLHADAEVLLLDEPTRGIDVASKAQVYALIDRLACGDTERGIAPRAVLLVSSYLPELLGVCDRVAVMQRGRLGPVRPIDDVTEHDLLREALGAA